MEDMTEPPSTDPLKPKYKRVLLKMSGEAFGHSGQSGISINETMRIAEQLKRVSAKGVQLAVVVGGGNILRGAEFTAGTSVIKESTAHYMGMLATIMNGMAIQEALESIGCATRVMTALRLDNVAEFFIRRRAIRLFRSSPSSRGGRRSGDDRPGNAHQSERAAASPGA